MEMQKNAISAGYMHSSRAGRSLRFRDYKGNYNRASDPGLLFHNLLKCVQPLVFYFSVSALKNVSRTAPFLPWPLHGMSLTGKRAQLGMSDIRSRSKLRKVILSSSFKVAIKRFCSLSNGNGNTNNKLCAGRSLAEKTESHADVKALLSMQLKLNYLKEAIVECIEK